MASEISQMSDSSIVIIQGTVGLYTVATRCHTCFAVTLKYTEDSSLTILRHSLYIVCERLSVMHRQARLPEIFEQIVQNTPILEFGNLVPEHTPSPLKIEI